MDQFIARQPIFDATRDVVAYELLFRDGLSNCFSGIDGNEATRQVLLNAFVLFGLSRLTAGKPAFINFTRNYLFNDLIRLFPPQSVVVELLENVAPDPEVLAACRWLKEAGYTLALDDVASLEPFGELVNLVDVVKVDFRLTDELQQAEIAKQLARTRTQLLAEKVETHEQFRQAVDQGYALFQGYFFARPEVVQKRDVPGNRVHHLRLMREIRKPQVAMERLESVVKQDISLSYRLLRYINSPVFGLRAEVRSVRHALTLLGERDIRRWAMLAALASASSDKPTALLQTGLQRARCCEALSGVLGDASTEASEELFLMGLFSVLDALLDMPLEDAIREAGVPSQVKSALLGVANPLRNVLDLVVAFESADWTNVSRLTDRLGIDGKVVASIFVDAVDWATQATSAQAEPVWSSIPPRSLRPSLAPG